MHAHLNRSICTNDINEINGTIDLGLLYDGYLYRYQDIHIKQEIGVFNPHLNNEA